MLDRCGSVSYSQVSLCFTRSDQQPPTHPRSRNFLLAQSGESISSDQASFLSERIAALHQPPISLLISLFFFFALLFWLKQIAIWAEVHTYKGAHIPSNPKVSVNHKRKAVSKKYFLSGRAALKSVRVVSTRAADSIAPVPSSSPTADFLLPAEDS